MSQTILTVGPDDHGRRMTLDEFERADAREGYLYELARGVVVVNQVPHPRHARMVDSARQQLSEYRGAHRERIHMIAGGGECKLLIESLASERHPDLAVYCCPPPLEEDDWASWIPEIVVEVVSPSSLHRDYEEKPEEYLQFGVREYWILDADQEQLTVLRRSRGKWSKRIVRTGQVYTTGLLPGLQFDCKAVFNAAVHPQ